MPTMLYFLQTPVDPHITSGYLILGYGIMWLIAFVYVMSLWTQQRNMQRDIELMKRILSDSDLKND
ncbi:MAG: putative membrane protein [Cellvibrionaceae bacterium]|jgi:uncharacterized membrane protein